MINQPVLASFEEDFKKYDKSSYQNKQKNRKKQIMDGMYWGLEI